MAEKWKIEGKNFLVTGGASGLGAANVRELLENRAKIVAVLDINEEAGKSILENYNRTYPGKVIFVKCDVADDDNLTRCFNQVLAKLERIDAIINNAGIVNDSPDQWFSCVDINLKGLINLTWKGIKHMRKDKGGAGGTIINVASIAAFVTTPGIPVYSATKAAVVHFGRCASTGRFYKNTGVRVMTICYGGTDTGIYQKIEQFPCDELSGNELQEMISDKTLQKVEFAGKSIITMLKIGENGSIWLSSNNEEVKNITSIVDTAFDNICKEIY